MPRNIPKQLPGMVSAADIAIIGGELALALLVPGAGVPALIATLLLALARGATLLQYLALVRDVLQSLESLMAIIVHLKSLGLFGEADDCCEQIKRIADNLQTIKPDETIESIAARLKIMSDDWRWTNENGQEIKVSESLGRLLFYGYYHSSQQP